MELIIALFVVGLVCGGFGAYVAMTKERPIVEGFLFGAFLGPLGVLIEVLLPMMTPEREVAESIPEDRRVAHFLVQAEDEAGGRKPGNLLLMEEIRRAFQVSPEQLAKEENAAIHRTLRVKP